MRLWTATAILAVSVALTACAAKQAEEAPAPQQQTAAAPAPAPAPEPAPAEPLECGQASFYADKFVGRPTASGEPYAHENLTAAHKTLPFGTVLVVTRPGTDFTTTVTVNDRGPFTPGRIIDLSRSAAEQIDLVTVGVAEVCIAEGT